MPRRVPRSCAMGEEPRGPATGSDSRCAIWLPSGMGAAEFSTADVDPLGMVGRWPRRRCLSDAVWVLSSQSLTRLMADGAFRASKALEVKTRHVAPGNCANAF